VNDFLERAGKWRNWKMKLCITKKLLSLDTQYIEERVHCRTEKLQPNWRITIDRVPLLVQKALLCHGELSPSVYLDRVSQAGWYMP
jgi:hypothetical protein